MKQLNLLTIILALFATQTLTAQPNWQWAYAFGSEDANAYRTYLKDISTDNEANYYIGGSYDGTIKIGPYEILDEDNAGNESLTGMLIKCNSSGEYQWHKQIYSDDGTAYIEAEITGIATDGSNDVYITGYFNGTVVLSDDISITSTGTSTESMFIIKYGADGTVIWADEVVGTNTSRGEQLITDADNNVFVTGNFDGTADFNGTEVTAIGGKDVFVAKYNSSGIFLWVSQAGDTGYDFGSSISTDNNSVFVIGRFDGTPTIGTTTLANGTGDMFIAKCSSEGVWQNAVAIYSSVDDFGYYTGDIDCDDAGNVFVTGPFNTDIDFGGGAVNYSNHPGYIAKYDNTLSLDWHNIIAPNQDEEDNGSFNLTTDTDNNVSVIGAFKGSIDFGTGTTITDNGYNQETPYIAQYNNAGEIQYAQPFNAQQNPGGAKGLAIDAYGNKLFVAGEMNQSISIGGFLLVQNGALNMFVASDFALASTENDILSFTLDEQAENAIIDNTNHAVEIIVVSGTDISNLTPTIAISDFASISPDSGTPQDFTSPVEYTVTAENNDQQVWIVTVDIETGIINNDISHFSVYPNPSNGILYFNLNLEASARPSSVAPSSVIPYRFIITNINGKTIYTRGHVPLDCSLQIDLSNHPKGIYFITINTENDIYTEKLIIQ